MSPFDSSIGAFVIGTIFAIYLTGVTTTQAFSYYTTFPNDRRLYFWLVTVLLFIDVFHTAVSCYTIYYMCVTIYGQVALLARVPWSFAIEKVFSSSRRNVTREFNFLFDFSPALTGIAASLVQVFYAYRVYIVSGRKLFLPIVILCLSAIQCGFSIGGTIEIFLLNFEVARFHTWTYGVTIWLIASSVTDILITGSLIFYLRQVTDEGEHARTNSIVRTILRNTIETNGLTCVVAIVDAALFLASNQSWHVIANLSLTKLYFNSLLVSLNSREKLTARVNGGQNSSNGEMNNKGYGTNSKAFGVASGRNNYAPHSVPIPIVVTMQETVIDTDYASEKDLHPFSRTVANTQNDGIPVDVELNELRSQARVGQQW